MQEKDREILIAVNAYMVEYRCGECDGVMRHTGAIRPGIPGLNNRPKVLYEHCCIKCGAVEFLERIYPYQKFLKK